VPKPAISANAIDGLNRPRRGVASDGASLALESDIPAEHIPTVIDSDLFHGSQSNWGANRSCPVARFSPVKQVNIKDRRYQTTA
jgi:hypothetical protein